MKNLTVWDAIIAWRDHVLHRGILRKSKVDYLYNMTKLIEVGLIDLQQPLLKFMKTEFDDSKFQEISTVYSWPTSTKRSRKTLLNSFWKFAQKQEIKKTPIEIPIHSEHRYLEMLAISELLSSSEDKAKSQYLTDKEINRFLNELRHINARDFLVCRTMWELKCTIHQVLNMKVGDYDPEKGVFKIDKFDSRYGNLRDDIKGPILKLCEKKANDEFIFSTDRGNRIHPGQIVRSMKIASKKANLPVIISPKVIFAHAKAFYERVFSAIAEKDRRKILEELDIQSEKIKKS